MQRPTISPDLEIPSVAISITDPEAGKQGQVEYWSQLCYSMQEEHTAVRMCLHVS